MIKYEEFLASKQHIPPPCGFEVDRSSMNQHMFEKGDIMSWWHWWMEDGIISGQMDLLGGGDGTD